MFLSLSAILKRIFSRAPLVLIFLLLLALIIWQEARAASYAGLKISVIPGPQCYDGQDNDGDGQIDYPQDPECDSASDNNEAPIIIPPPGGGGGGGGGGIEIIPSTNVIFSGYAYPYNQVTLLKDGQVALVSAAGGDAQFTLSLSGLSAGDYSFSIFSTDVHGLKSDTLTFSIYVAKGASTNISGILLSPTLAVNNSVFRLNDNITLFGQSVPNSQITISVHSDQEHLFQVNTNNTGIYSYDFQASVLEAGDHNAKSKTRLAQQLSTFSRVVNFLVLGPKDEAPLEEETTVAEGDLNNDAKINLIDFSILAYWYKQTAPPPAVDLNNDKIINLIDFSILAYYWTG